MIHVKNKRIQNKNSHECLHMIRSEMGQKPLKQERSIGTKLYIPVNFQLIHAFDHLIRTTMQITGVFFLVACGIKLSHY